MKDEIAEACASALPGATRVTATQPVFLSAGWESDIHRFTLEYDLAGQHCRQDLVLRYYNGAGAESKAANEFAAMLALHTAGYPVPWPVLVDADGARLKQSCMIMEFVSGQSLWPLLAGATGARQQELMNQFCALFVRLHRLDPKALHMARGEANPQDSLRAMLDGARPLLEKRPDTGLMPVLDWLVAQRGETTCDSLSVLHWDYHPGNLIVRPNGAAVVIDWTGCQVSDARFDLAWTLVLAGAYAGPPVRSAILEGYERHWGAPVQNIEYFEVWACARRLFDISVSLSQGAAEMGMRPGAAEQMREDRQATANVYQLLRSRTGLRIAQVEGLLDSLAKRALD